MRNLLTEAKEVWENFWFVADESRFLKVSVFRIIFGAIMALYFASRQQDVGFYYSSDGLMPVEYLRSIDFFKYYWTPLFYVDQLRVLQWLHVGLIVTCVSLSVGFFSNLSAFCAYALALSFFHRNPAAMFGVDTIAMFYFLYLIFAQSSEKLSLSGYVISRFRNVSKHAPSDGRNLVGNVVFRLMQVQLCIIYTYSGWEKLKGNRWWDGSAIWDVMSMGNIQRFDMSFVAHAPFLLAIIAYSVLIWEVYFVVLVCNQKLRKYVLLYGLLMHIGIIVFMNLPTFGALMMSTYILFLDGASLKGFVDRYWGKWKSGLTKKFYSNQLKNS
jgi:hypothetical protein